MAGDDDILREFLLESAENLNQLDHDFVALERDPHDRERLGAIFRVIHTIKGTCGFFELPKLEVLTHTGESVLSRLRDATLELDATLTSALLGMVDGVREILASIETTGTEGVVDVTPLVQALERAGGPAAPRVVLFDEPVLFDANDAETAPAEPLPEPVRTPTADTRIRVDVELLDQVMNLVGELVLTRNEILQFGRTLNDPAFAKASQRLNLLTSELQEGIMKTRMQPIGNVWNTLPRVVRDLALVTGKQVDVELDGADTELDRTIIEAIKDPLTHAVRNAVDHGIELPAQRQAAGKSAVGRLLLRAFHEGGQVNIEISDDGAGLDLDRIKRRAIERGLVSPDRASRLGAREIMHLIFAPGFSTAETLTNISGRGVGMDVVRTNIEKIGGTVDVASRPGQGMTLKIKIPLTLAIIPALTVTCGTHQFAIPQVNLLELVRLEGDSARKGIEHVCGAKIHRLRGNLLPLVFLSDALALGSQGSSTDDGDEVVNIVVLQADDRQFGLVVDGIVGTEEIVVKPLGKELKGVGTFAGATIMGDGRVALILDVIGVARHAGVVSASRDRAIVGPSIDADDAAEGKDSLLLFRVGEGRMALPLSMVARIEELPTSALERASGEPVVQYRGDVLPLVPLGRWFGHEQRLSGDTMFVIVHSEPSPEGHEERSTGLVVDEILDIVEENVAVRSHATHPGVIGAAIIQGKVTEVLDAPGVIRMAEARRHALAGAA